MGVLLATNKAARRILATLLQLTNIMGVKAADAPAPAGDGVRVRELAGGLFAAAAFPGRADAARAQAEAQRLRAALARDGLAAVEGEWALLRYNDPGTWPPLRLNEVLVPLARFDLWQ